MDHVILDQLRGHRRQLDFLSQAVRDQKLSSTFLFVGPSGVGRKQLALGLTQILVCESEQPACGTCGPCRRIAIQQSESLLVIAPEKNSITVDQSRQVLEFLSLRGLGKARAIIIDSCHLMNPAAANTLLKIFEEPPENTYFFLLAPSPRHVLPTIRSRSQVVRFGGLDDQDLLEVSRKLSATFGNSSALSSASSSASELAPNQSWLLQHARGSLDRLKELSSENQQETRSLAIEFLKECASDSEFFLDPSWRDFVKAREQAQQLARHILLLVRDLLIASKASESAAGGDLEIQGLLEAWEGRVSSLAEAVFSLEGALAHFRDPLMVFEEFWLQQSKAVNHVG